MNFPDNLNVTNYLVMLVGIIIILLFWQFLSTWTGEWARKVFKKQEIPNKRKTDDSEWFNRFLEHHDMLTKEIHEFTAVLMEAVKSMAETNKILSLHIQAVSDRDAVMMNDLKRIKNLTEGRK